MSKRRFTKEQIKKLLENKNVIRCSEKSITYAEEFKRLAVNQYKTNWMGTKQIFEDAGFDVEIIGKRTPKRCLERWISKYKTKGPTGLKDSRGRPRSKLKNENLSEKDKIKLLETEIAYLKAENSFLAKLRAKRRE